MSPELSIVLPCHNRRDALRLTLESLSRQTLPPDQIEVIVVDQASHDGSRELVRAMHAPYRLALIEQEAKHGISVARNAGVEAAAGRLVLLLDADLIAEPELAAAHVACHRDRPGALACGRVLPYPPAYTSFVDRSANPDAGLDRGEQEGALPFHQVLGGHLSFSVEAFRRVGPFDPGLRGFEDIDFAYRAERLGCPIVYCPGAVSRHNHPRTLAERCEQARSYNRMLPRLLERYPELRGAMPLLRDYEPLRWGKDGPAEMRAKLRARLYGLAPVQALFLRVLVLLERRQAGRRPAKILYWRLILGQWYRGFREGMNAGAERA